MKTLLLLLLLVLPLQSLAPEITREQKQTNIKTYLIYEENKKMYDEVINSLKLNEGLVLYPYLCPSNHLTIGYGHLIKRGEYYTRITKKEAENLLKTDFDKRLNLVDTSLPYNKRLALAHFIYNLGIGNYLRSKLHKKVQAKEPIDKEIIKWCYYRKNGKFVRSNWLLQSRKFELKLYNYENSNN